MIEIPLTRGKVALVDDEDYELVAPYKWCALFNGRHFYAVRSSLMSPRYMHRLIAGVFDRSDQVDHIDGDTLNNTRVNLRMASAMENQRNRGSNRSNTSGFKGVTWDKGSWVAQIGHHRSTLRIGRFATPQEAALAYDAKARELHGEFARLNFPS